MFLKLQVAVALGVLVGILGVDSSVAAAGGRAWYVDCSVGNDTADGLSPSTAWKSVDAVSARTFNAGDAIYFRRGSTCAGMLAPKGSGSATAPILLDAWGTGTLPQIHAEAGEEAALRLFDQEYWTIEHLDFSGGQPYGVFVSGTKGILHGIHLKDVVVHDVAGEPRNKETGLVVIAAGTEQQHFDGLLIDGVTAYHTSQWAGILVGGVRHGFPPEASRNTNVVIRNSIVHDVTGDGIVLFQVNKGLIENSVAWRTGMQDTQTIGTPNAIWTWMCRDCTVRGNEAFLTDSPGVDGGAYDIDYGNDNNAVEENYGHDTEGYCVAVFGAGWVTGNSVVRNNICAANGLSPRLARRQGAVFLSTWNRGKIKGLEISGNRIFWNPPLATAAIVNNAEFVGTGTFEKNTIRSCSPTLIRSNPSVGFDNNSFEDCAQERPHQSQQLCLRAFVSANRQDHESRGQIALLESIHRQFPQLQIEIVVNGARRDQSAATNLQYDWNSGDIPILFDDGNPLDSPAILHRPALRLTNASGQLLWRHDGLTPPGELGLFLRSLLGNPQYSEMYPDR